MATKPTYRKAVRQTQDFARFGSRTDIGNVRQDNEDSLIVAAPLFAVADGMGGHEAGEVASEIAINALSEHAPKNADAEALGRAVVAANHAVLQAAAEGQGGVGMGTTMTAAILEGERLVIAQVGDSRAYLLHQGDLQQLTRDHSLMADMIEAGQITPLEARSHPSRSVITRALGSDPSMLADLYEINVEAGDRLLLCSDGLSSMIPDGVIEEVLAAIADPQRCADRLVNEALAAGGHDNVTVIVVDVSGFLETKLKKTARRSKVLAIVIVLAAVVVIVAAFVGFSLYANNSYYLADDNGMVAIYQGIPGSLFGFSASHLESDTDIAVKDLQPGVASRLQDGIRVNSLDEAQGLLDEYRKSIEGASTPGSTGAGNSGTAARPHLRL
ncbi:MAG: Stp1/IreP family PP2C-type Ser/Thr phosphatase, partial [Eggerthellaceae bacterium]|nr:Stp1/IreP family PP2C-type Ser/Thr phosphatase [Eggerthellaceae bacterium]